MKRKEHKSTVKKKEEKRETRKARAEGEGSRGKQSSVKATWTALFVPYLFALTHPVHPLLESRSDLTVFAVLRSLTRTLCTLSFRNKKRRRNQTKKCYALLTTNQTYRFGNCFLFIYLLFSECKNKKRLKKKKQRDCTSQIFAHARACIDAEIALWLKQKPRVEKDISNTTHTFCTRSKKKKRKKNK